MRLEKRAYSHLLLILYVLYSKFPFHRKINNKRKSDKMITSIKNKMLKSSFAKVNINIRGNNNC